MKIGFKCLSCGQGFEQEYENDMAFMRAGSPYCPECESDDVDFSPPLSQQVRAWRDEENA